MTLSGIEFRDSANLNNQPEGILVKRYFASRTTVTQDELFKKIPNKENINQIVG